MYQESVKNVGKMHKHASITKSRLDLFLSDGNQFTDVSLIPYLYKSKISGKGHIQIKHYPVPNLNRIPFSEAIKNIFAETDVGRKFGPSWATHWFHITARVPEDWKGEEVQFRWNSDSEVLIYSTDGDPIQALTGEGGGNQRLEYVLTESCKGGEVFEFYLEMACNGLFGTGPYLIGPPEEREYPIRMAELAIPNKMAFKVFYDFQLIRDMAKKLPEKSYRQERALFVANKIMNTFQREERNEDSLKECFELSSAFLSSTGPINNHTLVAVGHCHIDTAWLWPYDETKRKVARSWSTQLQLMEKYPEFTFVCSQAQQFEWLQQLYPTLFKRVCEKVEKKQFLPIGGTWVEMDCNIPSGEGFCRQFLLGQRYFEKEFGKRCRIFWLPDTFGYSAQLPQIIKEAKMDYFFTQKLSWNNINKFPHTTFFWKGIDGTRVLAHMAPGDTYNAQVNIEEILYSVSNNKDKAIANQGLYLFGNGDGGGGPLPSMIERMNRLKDVEGLPKVKMGNALEFYDEIANLDEVNELPEWDGELYLELHRGTYTSHAIIKKYNRYCEFLLREVELFWTLARVKANAQYPHEELTHLWKLVCLNQFHDVLPGSSIGLVYEDAIKFYEEVDKKGKELIKKAAKVILGDSNEFDTFDYKILNPSAWDRSEIVTIPLENEKDIKPGMQISKNKQFGYVEVDKAAPLTLSDSVTIEATKEEDKVSLEYIASNGTYILRNRYIKVVINSTGQIISLLDLVHNREVIEEGKLANLFKIYEDVPLYWDAWDAEVYHLEKYDLCHGHLINIEDQGPLVSSILVDYKLSNNSSMKQIIKLTATSKMIEFDTNVFWNENRKFLKVEFNTNLRSDHAIYETQFGIIRRPTHFNTSWDLAKFEVCSHKFATLQETGYGLSVINDSKYGFATHGSTMRLSLIRSPKSPDKYCDIGNHQFKYTLYPHGGTFSDANVPKYAHAFNSPLKAHKSKSNMEIFSNNQNIHLFQLKPNKFDTTDSVILETVKIAEDDNNAVILRFYESAGAHSNPLLIINIPVIDVQLSNILEDDVMPLNIIEHLKDKGIQLKFKPFQIITLKIRFA
ncbi:hypothetical protein K502DRAFT_317167 [Neoconidiobolus thromboides FSU 785]|nr:hypothetical protein K502DRAFT_317167 [Neoconidiobolus thromboides FSU 785]